MLQFIEVKIEDNNCDNFVNKRDVIASVDNNEFDLITHDRKKLIQ